MGQLTTNPENTGNDLVQAHVSRHGSPRSGNCHISITRITSSINTLHMNNYWVHNHYLFTFAIILIKSLLECQNVYIKILFCRYCFWLVIRGQNGFRCRIHLLTLCKSKMIYPFFLIRWISGASPPRAMSVLYGNCWELGCPRKVWILQAVVLGDWNEILHISEKLGDNLGNILKIQNFRHTMHYLDLIDIDFKGNMFTWKRGYGHS